VQAWKVEQQADSAVQVKTPAGGWDGSATPAPAPAAPPAAAKRKATAVAPKLDLVTPR
jgi:hypothetical protein